MEDTQYQSLISQIRKMQKTLDDIRRLARELLEIERARQEQENATRLQEALDTRRPIVRLLSDNSVVEHKEK